MCANVLNQAGIIVNKQVINRYPIENKKKSWSFQNHSLSLQSKIKNSNITF